MSYDDQYRITVEPLENGFTVCVPDMEAIDKARADAKKRNPTSLNPSCYIGDCTKKFAAKSVAEVVKLVKESLENLPENEYDAAFSEASKAAS